MREMGLEEQQEGQKWSGGHLERENWNKSRYLGEFPGLLLAGQAVWGRREIRSLGWQAEVSGGF